PVRGVYPGPNAPLTVLLPPRAARTPSRAARSVFAVVSWHRSPDLCGRHRSGDLCHETNRHRISSSSRYRRGPRVLYNSPHRPPAAPRVAMNAPFFVSPPMPVPMPEPAAGMGEVTDLLRQLLEAQREQVMLLKHQAAMQDQNAKWKAFLSKWAGEYPDLGGACKQSLPLLERAFLALIRELTNRLKPEDPDDLENEY